MNEWWPTIIATVSAIVVAGAGGALTEIGPWYRSLKKPSWNPPDWAFGPVWTTIFTLAAIAGVKAWNAAASPGQQACVAGFFALNAVLNVAWSFLFFRLHRPDWAMVENVFLWLSVLALIVALAPFSPVSSWLLAPYLVWVSIAAFLNWTIVRMNAPFGLTQSPLT